MIVRKLVPDDKNRYDSLVTHPVQSWEWGEFRIKCGIEVIRLGLFDGNELVEGLSATVHEIPGKLPILGGYKVMNIPRCTPLSREMIEGVKNIAMENGVIFAKIEPDVWSEIDSSGQEIKHAAWNWPLDAQLKKGKTSFAPYSAMIDLNLSEEELLGRMKQKTRYNLRLAQKKGVVVEEDNSEAAFEEYLKLTRETTRRQKFYAHSEHYHKLMWQTLNQAGIARLMVAKYEGKIISTWVLFAWGRKLYYPYGASSREHQDVMANNLMMWEAIRLGKQRGQEQFDLWGTLGPEADESDPWFGFHKFKLGFGPTAIKFVESRDLVIDQMRYQMFNWSDNRRRQLLNWKAKFLSAINYPD